MKPTSRPIAPPELNSRTREARIAHSHLPSNLNNSGCFAAWTRLALSREAAFVQPTQCAEMEQRGAVASARETESNSTVFSLVCRCGHADRGEGHDRLPVESERGDATGNSEATRWPLLRAYLLQFELLDNWDLGCSTGSGNIAFWRTSCDESHVAPTNLLWHSRHSGRRLSEKIPTPRERPPDRTRPRSRSGNGVVGH